jgi:segregation and condensation protein B
MAANDSKALLESLLFVSGKPLSADILAEISGLEKKQLRDLLDEMAAEYESGPRGFVMTQVAGGYQLRTRDEYASQINALFQKKSRRRFTRSGLETLSIVAYRQPVTRSEIEHIRGVDSGGVLKTLLSQEMVRVLGRKEAPGKPILYGTTREFLEYFGLRDLESLPTLKEVTDLLEEGEVAKAAVTSEEAAAVKEGTWPRQTDSDENTENRIQNTEEGTTASDSPEMTVNEDKNEADDEMEDRVQDSDKNEDQ